MPGRPMRSQSGSPVFEADREFAMGGRHVIDDDRDQGFPRGDQFVEADRRLRHADEARRNSSAMSFRRGHSPSAMGRGWLIR